MNGKRAAFLGEDPLLDLHNGNPAARSNVCRPSQENWVMLRLHIARVYLMPDSFNGLNYAWRIIACEAFIFK